MIQQNKHQAILSLYPQVVRVFGDTAYDENGDIVQYDEEQVINWVDPNAYKQKRVAEYPSIGDQLDALFKAGVFPSDMAAQIQAIKDKYPKV